MKYCSNCGSTVNENNQFCHECGEKITNNTSYSQYSNTNTYNTYTPSAPTVSKKNAIISFVLSLINIELAFFTVFPYVCFLILPGSIILSIFGIKKANQYKLEAGKSNAFATIGKVLSIISLACAGFMFLFGLWFTFDPYAGEMFMDAFLYGYTGGIYGDLYGDLGGGYYGDGYYF